MKTKNLSLGLLGALACTGIGAAEKPNVVIVIVDDMGWGDVSYHGSKIHTPNIDRIARNGIELDRYYTAPVSSPTRAGLMTGRYPSRFGIRETVIPPWRDYGLDTQEKTLADLLAENGYPNRAMIGKWHLGHSRRAYHPLSRGFTRFYGCLNGAIDYFTLERDGQRDWHDDWQPSRDEGYSTDLITREAVACIGKYSGEEPFFLYVAYNAPHSPFQAPEEEIRKHISKEKFDSLKKRGQDGYTYRAMVTRLDAGVGGILDALEATGELDNTIILFMSDNGGVSGIPLGSTCAPLRGNKFEEWDGGVRTVAAIWWPKGFENGRKTDQVTGYIDIMPTIAGILGVREAPGQPYDGIDISAVLRGGGRIERDLYLGCGAAVNSNYKMALAGKNNAMKLTEDFLAYYPDDPYETRSHLQAHPQEAARLREYIVQRDAIVPSVRELPYGFGREGFVAPENWIPTKP